MRQIGYDVGRQGLKDSEIIPLLLQWRRATFFSLDAASLDQVAAALDALLAGDANSPTTH